MAETIIEQVIDVTERERREASKQYPGPTQFVHLHNHTLFSPLDGIATPEEYFSAASYLGQPAFSITDHGTMANIPDAFWAAKKNKVKFIPGCEIYFNPHHLEFLERREDPDFSIQKLKEIDYDLWSDYRTNRHLTVMAMNMTGFRNLLKLSSEAWEKGFYYKPRIWFEQIEKYNEGLIILSGCLNGPVCHNLRRSKFYQQVVEGVTHKNNKTGEDIIIPVELAREKAKKYRLEALNWIKRFRDLLGDRFYLEIQMPGEEISFGKQAFQEVTTIARQTGIPVVITNDCHYLNRNDFKVQKCMMAVDQGLTINDPNLFHVNSDEQFFKSRAQLRKTFFEGGYEKFVPPEFFEEACDNTVALAERCDTFNPNLDPKLPEIPDADRKLTEMVYRALKERGLWDNHKRYNIDGQMVTYKEQADIELRRYISKGFASYFLIIQDLVSYSRGQGWDVGPGRGSAGGSLVCYLLGIHSLDPLKWDLSSVRFMGDSRGGKMLKVSMD